MSREAVEEEIKYDLETYIKILQACNELAKEKDMFTSVDIGEKILLSNEEVKKYIFSNELIGLSLVYGDYFEVKSGIYKKDGEFIEWNLSYTQVLKKLGIKQEYPTIIRFKKKEKEQL